MREFGVAALLQDPGHSDVIRAAWPLHITITPNFAIDATPAQVTDLLCPVIAAATPIPAEPGPDADFGPNAEYRVVLVEPADLLARLHSDLDRVLAENGATWVSPFRGSDYRPHATVTANGIRFTEPATIGSVVYLEIAPDGDPRFARILGLQTFGSHTITAPMARADAEDAARIVDLRDAAARWQRDRGITQWTPGDLRASEVEAEIGRGEWWVSRPTPGGPPAGAVRIVDEDPAIWPDATESGYIHGLMVARDRVGEGLGARILAWAEAEVARRGNTWARLDCVASNSALRRYYTARGYRERGIIEYPPESGWQPSARFEKRVSGLPAPVAPPGAHTG